MVEARRTVGTLLATVEDVGIVEPSNPFWLPLWDAGDGQLVTMHGSTDGVGWIATAQADRVKIAPRKYERGWARLIAFEVGFYTSDSGIGARALSITKRTTFDYWSQEEPDLAPLLERSARAALTALDVLERSRRFSQQIHKQSEPDLRIEDLTIEQQVIEVARVWNEAADEGIRARRAQVVAVLGFAERTANRRIREARELGLIKEEGR